VKYFLLACIILDIGNPPAKIFPVLLCFIYELTVVSVHGHKWNGTSWSSLLCEGGGVCGIPSLFSYQILNRHEIKTNCS
jgi:hypothetical protein